MIADYKYIAMDAGERRFTFGLGFRARRVRLRPLRRELPANEMAGTVRAPFQRTARRYQQWLFDAAGL